MKLKESIPLWLRGPRSTVWAVVTVLLLAAIGLLSPVQLPVVLYKVLLVSLAAVVGYWLDRSLFPYARPDSYLCRDWRHGTNEPVDDPDYPVVGDHMLAFCVASLRRAIVVGAVVLAMALGL